MTDTEILSTARYIKRLETIATDYKTQSMRLTEENQRLSKAVELLEQALIDMEDFHKASCKACKYCKDDYCTLDKLSSCSFEWIYQDEALKVIRGENDESEKLHRLPQAYT